MTNREPPNRHSFLVAEVTAASEDHRRAGLRDRGDHALVAA
jgi:hypothetical protein